MRLATTLVTCPRCGSTWEQSIDAEEIGVSSCFTIEPTPAEHVCPAVAATPARGHLRRVV